ncbi:DUF2164 domain-containing protein [Paenibacillus spiritus]|uniref:DUF2164 domain-containing protein n=1 Tax=Paenibacillus spiritus TaxID=2496557 RepID=A0A5J5FWY8_9BACL|nr:MULTISPECIES: DUF2164 domain-containing protein [Paenibacillus]KAA8998365.1 DUF2164 domain-containing protein [Paenibacillus spiritus]
MKAMKLPKERREALVSEFQAYFELERGEAIGELAASNLLDFCLEHLGPVVYNQALADCRLLAAQRMQGLEEDIYALEWRARRK